MKRNSGFTLIELVIVIIILGILAATAVPKFLNLQDDAKKSAMKGVEGALHSAANIVYSKAAVDGVETLPQSSVSDAGATISTVYGYPAATTAGINAAIELSGFNSKDENGKMMFWNGSASTAKDTCVVYTPATQNTRYSIESKKCK